MLASLFSSADASRSGTLDFAQFQVFVRLLTRRPEIDALFSSWCARQGAGPAPAPSGMTKDTFGLFLTHEQKMCLTGDALSKLFRRYADVETGHLGLDGFTNFLLSSDNCAVADRFAPRALPSIQAQTHVDAQRLAAHTPEALLALSSVAQGAGGGEAAAKANTDTGAGAGAGAGACPAGSSSSPGLGGTQPCPSTSVGAHAAVAACAHDMDRPLSEYFIAASHNTYLVSGQLVGGSGVEGLVRALQAGARSIELDCWDGPHGEPLVTHGRTLTTRLGLREAARAVAKYAFAASPWPLILCLEVHNTFGQQDALASILRSELGPALLTHRLTHSRHTPYLPSPLELLGRILVKAKDANAVPLRPVSPSLRATVEDLTAPLGQVPTASSSEGCSASASDDTASDDSLGHRLTRRLRHSAASPSASSLGSSVHTSASASPLPLGRKPKRSLSPRLAELLIYTIGVKFRGFGRDLVYPPEHMISFSETGAKKLFREQEDSNGAGGLLTAPTSLSVSQPGLRDQHPFRISRAGSFSSKTGSANGSQNGNQALMEHTRSHLVRIYPSLMTNVTRGKHTSANPDPLAFWMSGCQQVALNWQTSDLGLELSHAMFARNAAAGYVLKPSALRHPSITATAAPAEASRDVAGRLGLDRERRQEVPAPASAPAPAPALAPPSSLSSSAKVRIRMGIRVISAQLLPRNPSNWGTLGPAEEEDDSHLLSPSVSLALCVPPQWGEQPHATPGPGELGGGKPSPLSKLNIKRSFSRQDKREREGGKGDDGEGDVSPGRWRGWATGSGTGGANKRERSGSESAAMDSPWPRPRSGSASGSSERTSSLSSFLPRRSISSVSAKGLHSSVSPTFSSPSAWPWPMPFSSPWPWPCPSKRGGPTWTRVVPRNGFNPCWDEDLSVLLEVPVALGGSSSSMTSYQPSSTSAKPTSTSSKGGNDTLRGDQDPAASPSSFPSGTPEVQPSASSSASTASGPLTTEDLRHITGGLLDLAFVRFQVWSHPDPGPAAPLPHPISSDGIDADPGAHVPMAQSFASQASVADSAGDTISAKHLSPEWEGGKHKDTEVGKEAKETQPGREHMYPPRSPSTGTSKTAGSGHRPPLPCPTRTRTNPLRTLLPPVGPQLMRRRSVGAEEDARRGSDALPSRQSLDGLSVHSQSGPTTLKPSPIPAPLGGSHFTHTAEQTLSPGSTTPNSAHTTSPTPVKGTSTLKTASSPGSSSSSSTKHGSVTLAAAHMASVGALAQGYHHLPLYDAHLNPLPHSTLFVHVSYYLDAVMGSSGSSWPNRSKWGLGSCIRRGSSQSPHPPTASVSATPALVLNQNLAYAQHPFTARPLSPPVVPVHAEPVPYLCPPVSISPTADLSLLQQDFAAPPSPAEDFEGQVNGKNRPEEGPFRSESLEEEEKREDLSSHSPGCMVSPSTFTLLSFSSTSPQTSATPLAPAGSGYAPTSHASKHDWLFRPPDSEQKEREGAGGSSASPSSRWSFSTGRSSFSAS